MPARDDGSAAAELPAPEKPPPSIVDYRPRSTVVAPEHLVPKAKFPVVDIHNHIDITAGNIEQMVRDMDELNLRVLVNLSGGSGAAVQARDGLHPQHVRTRTGSGCSRTSTGTAPVPPSGGIARSTRCVRRSRTARSA